LAEILNVCVCVGAIFVFLTTWYMKTWIQFYYIKHCIKLSCLQCMCVSLMVFIRGTHITMSCMVQEVRQGQGLLCVKSDYLNLRGGCQQNGSIWTNLAPIGWLLSLEIRKVDSFFIYEKG
jgi:hypothetical protein